MILDLMLVDTDNGRNSPFSPPARWRGEAADYIALMRDRYFDRMHGQRMMVQARFARTNRVTFRGRFAEEAKSIVRSINDRAASNKQPQQP